MKYNRAAKVYVEVLNGKPPSNQRLQRVPRNIFLFEFFVESWMKFVVSWNTKKKGENRERKNTKLHFRLAENRSFSVTFRRSLSQVARIIVGAGLAHKVAASNMEIELVDSRLARLGAHTRLAKWIVVGGAKASRAGSPFTRRLCVA